MPGRQAPLFTRTVPNGKEKIVPPESIKGWHRVFYRASQVERCLRPEDFVVGKRLAVLEHRHEFHSGEQMPPCVFYTGVVEKVWGTDSDIVTIKYDANPFAVNISFGIKHNYMFCIPVPKAKSAKTKNRLYGAMTNAFLPCPFCGGRCDPPENYGEDRSGQARFVECFSCKASIYRWRPSREEADAALLKAWNARRGIEE